MSAAISAARRMSDLYARSSSAFRRHWRMHTHTKVIATAQRASSLRSNGALRIGYSKAQYTRFFGLMYSTSSVSV